MKTPEYPIKRIEKSSIKKFEQEPDVPIIDIIRHGETYYKQVFPEDYDVPPTFNPKAADFKFDWEHLDLTPEGIETIESSANQLADIIDIPNEVVLIVSSSTWRTHSSALVLEKVLKERGVNILNFTGEIKLFHTLAANPLEYKGELHSRNFHRFLRHMNNIYDYLNDDTKRLLKGKKLRVVCLAHKETTGPFLYENAGIIQERGQIRGQILEIKPRSKLRSKKE